MSQFLLDANIFIQANRFTYPMDVFPGFWDWLDREFDKGVIASIKPVYEELTAGDDALAQWTKERKENGWFHNIDDGETQENYGLVAEWAVNPANGFKETAYEEFLSIADSWIVAKAMTERFIIVTHELYRPERKKRIPIPNACKEFDVPYINTIELFRRIGVSFGLR